MKINFQWKNIIPPKYAAQISDLIWLCIPGAALIMTGFLLFGPAGRDDAHITYWQSYTLVRFGEILNYNGVRVEQSSSLLQVILLAVMAKVTGLELADLGRISSIIFGAMSVTATAMLTSKTAGRAAGFSAALITSIYPYFVYWSFGGLESALVPLTGIFLIVAAANYSSAKTTNPRLLPAILAMALFGIVRPETPILLGCLLVGAILITLLKEHFNKEPGKITSARLFRLFGIYALICAGIFVFRLWYFGDLFPQPVAAKSNGINLISLSLGAKYVAENFRGGDFSTALLSLIMAGCFLIVLARQIKAREFNLYLIFSMLYSAGYLSFVILTGGDWMEGGRFLTHFIPILITMIPIALTDITGKKLPLLLTTVVVILLEVISLINFTQKSSTGTPLWSHIQISRSYNAPEYSWFERRSRINVTHVYLIDYLDQLVAEISRQHKPVTIMSAQMGIIPYHISMKHFGDVRFLDRVGLTDRTFTDCTVTRDRPGSLAGISVSYQYFFENFPQIEQTCQVDKPDIIFDVTGSDLTAMLLKDNGYVVMYKQTGYMVNDEKWLAGFAINGWQILGVRGDLLESLKQIKPVFIKLGFSN